MAGFILLQRNLVMTTRMSKSASFQSELSTEAYSSILTISSLLITSIRLLDNLLPSIRYINFGRILICYLCFVILAWWQFCLFLKWWLSWTHIPGFSSLISYILNRADLLNRKYRAYHVSYIVQYVGCFR